MMRSLPIISIVTPSYNQAEFLEECIESVLAQGYPRLEYVIMDGGSTDGSVEIIKKYEKYLTYWQSQPDGGQYRAINEGFRRTSGEIMAWLNSDDKYHPLALFKVACSFTDYPEIEWLTGRKSFWDTTGNLARVEEGLAVFSQRKLLEGHFNKPYIQQESTFWLRSLWERAGASLDDTIELAGDLELWARFFRHAGLHTVDTLLGGYRFHEGQRGVVYAQQYRQECITVVMREQQLCQAAFETLAAPPASVELTRERLASLVDGQRIHIPCPSYTRCWCEYTEDLIVLTKGLLQEHQGELAPFWQREVSLFSLAKPRAALLLDDTLDSLSRMRGRVQELLDRGACCETADAYQEALAYYREAAEQMPAWALTAENLLRCLLKAGEVPEALGRLPGMLTRHAHDPGVVRMAVLLLNRCGAREQAQGVCDEYLMVNPHDETIRIMRDEL